NLKGELSSVEAKNAKLSDEVENLMTGYLEDSIRLQSNLERLNSSLEFIQSQEEDARLECPLMAERQPDYDGAHGCCKFKKVLQGYLGGAYEQNHELAIELFDGILELRNAKAKNDVMQLKLPLMLIFTCHLSSKSQCKALNLNLTRTSESESDAQMSECE
ncbi:hypothetical protein Tco_0436073, partial [Tanacetum coccineum]